MAAESELWQDEVDKDVLADIVKIQAWVRGLTVRKRINAIRRVYEDIVHDLDGADMKVEWSHVFLSRPSVRKMDRAGLKVSDPRTSQGNCNQSNESQAGAGSVLTETKRQAAASHVSVCTSTDVAPQHHEVPCQTCATFHRNYIDTDVQYSHDASVDQWKQVVELENLEPITSRKLSVRETVMACSLTQTQEADFSQAQDRVDQSRTLMSQDRMFPSASATASVNCVQERSLNDRSAADSVADTGLQNDWTVETFQPEKLPADVFQLDQRMEEEPGCQTVCRELDTVKSQTEEKSGTHITEPSESIVLPDDKEQLLQLKNTVAMELLWIQQAICSRKHYLKLREQLN